jgi:hypothetical protein
MCPHLPDSLDFNCHVQKKGIHKLTLTFTWSARKEHDEIVGYFYCIDVTRMQIILRFSTISFFAAAVRPEIVYHHPVDTNFCKIIFHWTWNNSLEIVLTNQIRASCKVALQRVISPDESDGDHSTSFVPKWKATKRQSHTEYQAATGYLYPHCIIETACSTNVVAFSPKRFTHRDRSASKVSRHPMFTSKFLVSVSSSVCNFFALFVFVGFNL